MALIEDREYETKLQNLRRHAPFLKGMIDKLRTQERTQQVLKLESLWSMITSSKRLKFETLQKCEDVMLKIQSKSHAGVNKLDQTQSDRFNMKSPNKTSQPDKNVAVIMNAVKLNIARAKLHNEVVTPTPKSPSPDRDLHQHIPITIPMDKVDDFNEIASPDPDNDPAILWSETNENRYDSTRPDVYTNAVIRKTPEKPFFEPPKPTIPTVNINTPPISMQDLQQLEDSIPMEKKPTNDCKKEPSAEEKLLKRPSKVSLVPAPIIKPKHKKEGDRASNSEASKKSEVEKEPNKSTSESSKSQSTDDTLASNSNSKHKKSSESSSKHKSSSKSTSHKLSHQSSDKTVSTKHLSRTSIKIKDSKPKDCKSNPSKSPRRVSIEDQTNDKDTIFGNLLNSIDNTLLTEREVCQKKVPAKSIGAKLPCKPLDTISVTSDQDKSNKPPVTEVSIKTVDKPSEDKTVFKRLADKYNPRPKKRDPEIEQPIECVVSVRPEEILPNKPNDTTHKSTFPLLSGPPNFQHNQLSPSQESQFPRQQPHRFTVQQPLPRRPSFNPYDQQMSMSPMEFNQQPSPLEYDLAKVGPADFYANKSPPFNNRQPEPLMGVTIQHPDAFPAWNHNNDAHDFQGRILHQDHLRGDPRFNRQQQPELQLNIRFENTFVDNRPCDSNRFFQSDDINFVDANRFMRQNDNNFESNRFIRSENNVNQDRNKFFMSSDINFERQGDNSRFGRPGDNTDRSRDCNRVFMPKDNRFLKPNDDDPNRHIDNRFIRPGEMKDGNRAFKPLDKPEANRFVWIDKKNTSKHDDLHKEKSFPKQDELKRVQPKIEESRSDPRLQRHSQQRLPKVEPPSSSPVLPKKEVYDDLYSKINCKGKDECETFTSPLDSIYDKKQKVMGKGYGIQNFRIPKKPRPTPPAKCPTLPRKRSPSPPLRRPPTPPRKRRSPSPPAKKMLTSAPPPKIVDVSSNVPEIVAQLPESIRKDDRFGDVVNVLSSLLKDGTALTKIKKLLTKTKETKSNNNSDDDDEPVEKDVKQRKAKMVKRQPKKQSTATATKKSAVMKKSLSTYVDCASTDTKPTQVRRSGRLRQRVVIFDDDDDSEDDTANKNGAQDRETVQEQANEECIPPLTDEQLDDIVSCMDPFDNFLPDNEADQLVEEALKQPTEKLEEEINKQLVNDIFDSLKNDDNMEVPAEDTQKIIDSWGLAETNANKMIDSWDKNITDDLFDEKDEKDGDSSQDQQQDVRNEIDELIKNMPLNDCDKILDCDIAKESDVNDINEINKENDVVKSNITKENDEDEEKISKSDDDISSMTKKLIQENNDVEKNIQSVTEKDPSSDEKAVEMKVKDKLKDNDMDSEESISLKPLQTRQLRSSPRLKPPVSYTDDVKPRGKRSSKKQELEHTSPKKQEPEERDKVTLDSIENTENELINEELINIDSVRKPEIKEKIAEESGNVSTSENCENTNISPQDVNTNSMASKEIINLELVIIDVIAKYSAENDDVAPSMSTKESTRKTGKKALPKSKCKELSIQEEAVFKVEKNEEIIDNITNEESPIKVEKMCDKRVKKRVIPKEESTIDAEPVERRSTRNATIQIQDKKSIDTLESRIDSCKADVEKSRPKKGGRKSNVKETFEHSNQKDCALEPVHEVDESTRKKAAKKTVEICEDLDLEVFQNVLSKKEKEHEVSEQILITDDIVSRIDETSANNPTVVKPNDKSENVLSKDIGQPQEVDGSVAMNVSREISTEVVENLSVEVLRVEESPPTKKIIKRKRVTVKKRGKPFKIHPSKKKAKLNPTVESSATSEAGSSSTDLLSTNAETTVANKIGRPRRKQRSELDKLHEDIKETMGDKVLISKRTSTKSPRGAGEIEETEKNGIKKNYEEVKEETSFRSNERRKVNGLKVVVEKLPISKSLSIAKKGKLQQTISVQSEGDSSESDEDNDLDASDLSFELATTQSTGKRKKRNRKFGLVRQNKKRKPNSNKPVATVTDKVADDDMGEDSDVSDDIDTDYDVEFVEPDAEHYILKGMPTKCRLCDFEGVTLVDHYVNNHHAGEVPVSRLPPDDSKLALQDAKENNYYADAVPQNLVVKDNKKKKIRFTFTCRFCLQDFPQYSNVQFVDHIATHTGEYRHKCKVCDLKNASARFIKLHYRVVHGIDDENESNNSCVIIIVPPPLNFHTVFGYMCTECHFVQLSYRSVTEHIQIYHLDESAAAIKINMSLANGSQISNAIKETETMETGVFTSHDHITEEELQREEANRTELMAEAHKETQVAVNNRLNSVAALLKNRFDSNPVTIEETALESIVTTKEVALLPKAKPKEPLNEDIKPDLSELQQQAAVASVAISSAILSPAPVSLKYTIFIIGPLKAVVALSERTVDFTCITDNCVFYTTDLEDMAQHCRTAHDNRCERIRCDYCEFVGNAVPLVEVFEHICEMHVDPLLVKEEPMEMVDTERSATTETLIATAENANVEAAQKDSSPSPPRLPFMGNHFGIKIVSVAGGVLDDIVPINEQQDANTNSLEEGSNTVDTIGNGDGNNHLPRLLPIYLQSPSVLKKLSSLQKQTTATKLIEQVPSVETVVSRMDVTKSNSLSETSSVNATGNPPSQVITASSSSNTLINDEVINDNSSIDPSTTQLVSNDDDDDDVDVETEQEVYEEITELDVDDSQEVLVLLAKVTTLLPEASATAPKRRFHTGKTDLLYRCPDSKCGFASETKKEFELHLKSIGGGHSDLQRTYRCVYCYTMLPMEQYSIHLVYYHGTSEFGCSRCCYRAVAPYHIQLHKNIYHAFDQTDVILLPLAPDVPKMKVEQAMMDYTANKLKSLIKPFSCYCGERFIVTANYSIHLEKVHRNDIVKTGIDCRDCQMKGGKNMVAHYSQVHNNHLYHCVYCSFGVDTAASELFAHQSARHPGLPMDILVRTIAAEAPTITLASHRRCLPEDETVWSKVVRLINPQANTDLEIIKELRENSTSTTKLQYQNLRSTATQQRALVVNTKNTMKSQNIIQTIDLVALSPDARENETKNSSESNMAEEESPESINNTKPTSRATTPLEIISTAPSIISKPSTSSNAPSMNASTPLSPRCVTPTNQPILSPSVSSNIVTPDEDIFVVLQPSSEVPLAGSDLFVCAQCGIHCTTSGVFRAHVYDCVKLGLEAHMAGFGMDRDANSKPYGCAHCDKRCKTSTTLLDHMRVHGFPRYRCGLCEFKHTQPWNIRTHMRTEHNISTCVQVPAHPNKVDDDFDDFIYRPRQSQLAPPALINAVKSQSVTSKNQAQIVNQTNKEQYSNNKDRKLSGSSVEAESGTGELSTPIQKYLPTEIDKLSMRAVYTTEVGCALCGYKSKVRTNIIRHLNLHIDGLAPTDLPTTACVNPVPCLERDELMFDKMANLAYNSHQADLIHKASAGRMGGPATKIDANIGNKNKDGGKGKGTVDGNGTQTGPEYVPRSKRYVCGAVDCNYLCHDEIMFRRHIQALHSHSEVSYRCRHCPEEKVSAAPAMMNVELVLRHLRLHGTTLYKCSHCPFMHNLKSIIDRHITERHTDRNIANSKALITIRDLPEESDEGTFSPSGQNSANNSSSISNKGCGNVSEGSHSSEQTVAASKPVVQSAKDAKPWRCAMCKARSVTIEDIINHTTIKHKMGTRYKCGYCDYSSDDRDSYIPHFATHHPDSPTLDIITIYFYSPAVTSTVSSSTLSSASPLATDKDNNIGTTNESSDPDQSFDTTPLWRKPTTGDVRHIRGILLETRGQHTQHRRGEQHANKDGASATGRDGAAAEKGKKDMEKGGVQRAHKWALGSGGEMEDRKDGQGGAPPKKQLKRSCQTIATRVKKRAKQISTSSLQSSKQLQKQKNIPPPSQQEAVSTNTLVISVSVDPEIYTYSDTCNNLRLIDVNNLSVSKMLLRDNLKGKFGEYGRPTERGYKCPKCEGFETNGERQFLAHLYKEVAYMRYQCEHCNTRTALAQSVYLRCPMAPITAKPPLSDCFIQERIDADKEQWTLMVLAVQTRIAAHLTANGLWSLLAKGGIMADKGAGAAMRGLKLAYQIKGTFRPTDIFPKSPSTRFSITTKSTLKSGQPNNNSLQFQQPINAQSTSDNSHNISTSSLESTSSIEDDLPVSVIQRDLKPSAVVQPPVISSNQMVDVNKQQLVAAKSNIFVEVQNITPIAQMAPVLLPKQMHQRQFSSPSVSNSCNSRDSKMKQVSGDGMLGIQMFSEVVTVKTNSDKEVQLIEDDDDDDDDDDVEIIDPLVDTVDLDGVDAREAPRIKETTVSTSTVSSAADKDSTPVESVTVSNFLPTVGDTDPLMDEASYSDDDSVALEIAEEDDIDEEIEPELQISPNASLDTPTTNIDHYLPIKNASKLTKSPNKSPTTSKDEIIPNDQSSTTDTLLKLKPIECSSSTCAKDQEEQVSSTTSDVPMTAVATSLPVQQQGNTSGGILTTVTPLEPSLVNRLRVIGDASMVGCFGLSSDVNMQQQLLGDSAAVANLGTSGSAVAKGTMKQFQLYKCAHCTFGSTNIQSLKKHELRHWAEKPYRCGYVLPSGSQCNFQNHFRSNVFKHIRDVHSSIPEEQVPVIHVKISNPTIVGLRRQRSNAIDSEQATNINSANNSAGSSPLIPPAKRVRLLDSHTTDNAGGEMVQDMNEEFVARFTCPICTFTSHKARYVQQHLRLHVKCFKCQLCNEKDDQKKRLIEEKCTLHHKSVPSRLVIEYDSFELDRLKGLIQKMMVLKSSLQSFDQSQTVDEDNDNEFLEVYKTVRNYSLKQVQRKQQQVLLQQQQQQHNAIQLASQHHLTTFDVATSTYVPLQKQTKIGEVSNVLYRVLDSTATDRDIDGKQDAVAGPIVLNTLLSQPRMSNANSTQQPTARKSTGGAILSQIPFYTPPNFYTTPPNH